MSKSPSPKERSSEGSPDPSQICDRFRATLHDRMHAMVLKAVYDMFAEEVDRLCGPAYRRHADSSAHRAGSSPGSVLIDGRRVPVKKPRVKRNGKEVTLRSYEMLQSESFFIPTLWRRCSQGYLPETSIRSTNLFLAAESFLSLRFPKRSSKLQRPPTKSSTLVTFPSIISRPS